MKWLYIGLFIMSSAYIASAWGNVDYYRIYPTNFEVQADSIWHNSFHVANGNTQSIRLRLRTEQFDVGQPGPFGGDTSLIPPKNRHFNLTPYLHFTPKYMALPPFGRKRINIRVILPKDLKPGTYWGRVKFIMQAPPKNPLMIHRTAKTGFGTEIFALINESVPIYIDVKEQYRNLKPVKITCQKMAENKLKLTIKNPTNWAFEPTYHIKVDHEHREAFHQRTYPMMPQSKGTRYLNTFNHTILSDVITYQLPHSDKIYTLTCKPN